MVTVDSMTAPIEINLDLQIPIEHLCYADHFPGDPLVPGALLLKWIFESIEKNMNCSIVQVKQIKFLAPVRPTDYLNIKLEGDAHSTLFSLTVTKGNQQTIKGFIHTDKCYVYPPLVSERELSNDE